MLLFSRPAIQGENNMSYYATVDGMITFNNEADRSVITERLNNLFNECGPEIMTEEENGFTVCFGGYQNYREDEICRFLAEIVSQTESGEITYCGEDNSLWRHLFDSAENAWIEQDGYIEYAESGKPVKSIIEKYDERNKASGIMLKGDEAR